MKIVFRTDASVEIGSGHLMRCLTLADQLSSMGCEIAFICRDLPGAMFSVLEQASYSYRKLANRHDESISQESDANETISALTKLYPSGADWMVVDHYKLGAEWEEFLRTYAKKILAIDDLANRPHTCDILLDQNYYKNYQTRYSGLVADDCAKFLGPANVLFRPEFYSAAKKHKVRSGEVQRILVFFGASDVTNQTQKVLDCIPLLNRPDISFDVVVGISNPNREQIKLSCEKLPNVSFYCQVRNMSELMFNADLAIGAGGATTWERCLLGLPSITVVFAENQLETTIDLAEIGVTHFLGWIDQLTQDDYLNSINYAIQNPSQLHEMSLAAKKLISDQLPNGSKTLMQAMVYN